MDPFKEFGLKSGFGASYDGNANLFACLNYIAQAAAAKRSIVCISSRYSLTTYRICCSKQIIRWDPALVKFVELPDLLDHSLEVDGNKIFCSIKELVASSNASIVLFDDCSVFERLGIRSTDLVCSLLDLYSILPDDGLLFTQFSINSLAFQLLENKVDFCLRFENIGSGFGKDVSGKMTIATNGVGFLTEEKELLYHAGDRGTKYFFPGNVPLQL